jgi:poly(3-hydroxybutyrate) depolymerase
MNRRLGISVGFVLVAAACGYNPGPYTAPGQPDGAAGGAGGSGAVDVSIADGAHDAPGTGGITGTSDAKSTPDLPIGGGGQLGTGGLPATGGQVGLGGAPASGGTGAGGIVGTGGGGMGSGGVGAGGLSIAGGTIGAGGIAGTGGIGAGGKSGGTGGNPGTGGTVIGTGGKPGTGGGPGTGGNPGTGGTPGTGGSTGGASGRSAGCGQGPGIPASQYNTGTPISITAGGLTRRYVLNIPTNYDNTKPYQLVLALHALDGNDKQMYAWQYYGLLPLSNNTAIFAAPNGMKSGSPCTGTGSGESGCGWPNTAGQDMALMDAVIKQVEDNFCVDTNRIVATGWSYGASMAYEVGCERPLSNVGSAGWGVRAIAIYSGAQMSGSCKPSTGTPVAFYESHGINDSVLSYNGGVTLAQNFANADGCTWATPAKASGSHICTTISGCKSDYPVEFCSFVGDHTPFPDSGLQSSSWGPAEAWGFLSQF